MSITTLDEAMAAMFGFTGERQPGRVSLQIMAEAMPLLDDPHKDLSVVHITGTSGKTSTSYYVRALLEASGFRTGLTVSPHIIEFNERVQIAGAPLRAESFCGYVEQLLRRLAPMRGRMTYFELVICLAVWVFACERVDYAVIEVGIGGLRDATNIVNRPDKVAVIGPVGLDHTEKLGGTIAEIAAQKAGIIPPGGVAFVARQADEALDVIARRADQLGAEVRLVEPSELADPDVPVFQRGNWSLALAAVAHLAERDGFAMPDRDDLLALERVTPPARYEWFTVPPHRVLLDGAHNPQKMAGLVAAMTAQGIGPLPALATLSTAPHDKIIETVAVMAPVVSRLIVPEFQLGHADKVKQSISPEELAEAAKYCRVPVEIVSNLPTALEALLSDPAPDLLVTGSLYLAALVRPWLAQWQDCPQPVH